MRNYNFHIYIYIQWFKWFIKIGIKEWLQHCDLYEFKINT